MQEKQLQKLQQIQWQAPVFDIEELNTSNDRTNRSSRGFVNFLSHLAAVLLLAIITDFLQPPIAVATTSEWHSLDDIRKTAAEFVRDRAAKPGQNTTVTAGDIDYRLRLHQCDTTLEAYLPPGGRVATNTTVGVRCPSPRRWKLFVPVRVGVTAKVLIAAEPLPAGKVLTENDFLPEERDLGSLRGGYIRAGEPISGMVLKRPLPAGQPVRNELLTAPNIVQRGQQVTLRAGSEGRAINIRMAGTALSDGRLGERIRVKNRSSGRTVEGVVRSSEIVQIGY